MSRLVMLPLIVALATAGCLDEGDLVENDFKGSELDPPRPAYRFNLTAQDNASVNLSDYEGQVVVITFLYSSCPDVCPLLSAYLKQASLELGEDFGSRVQFLSITVDPARDTPENLSAYATARNLSWPHLTGSHEYLQQVWAGYGVAVEYPENSPYTNQSHGGDGEGEGNQTHEGGHGNHTGYEVGHSVVTYLLDKELNKRILFAGLPPLMWTSEDLVNDVRLLLAETAE